MSPARTTAAGWRLAGVLGLLAATGLAQAQTLAPGLWEVTSRALPAEAAGGTAAAAANAAPSGNVAEMAKLSPEQRRMMAEMTARRTAGAAERTARVCLTPAQAERDLLPVADPSCRVQEARRQGDRVRVAIACDGSPAARGDGDVVLSGPTGYGGRIAIDATANTAADGAPPRAASQISGRWLAADCGSVAPAR